MSETAHLPFRRGETFLALYCDNQRPIEQELASVLMAFQD
jgi:hypothetical protein